MRVFIFRISNFFKQNLQLIHHHQYNPNPNFSSIREFSQSTSIPKKQQRIRDHGYDNYMEIEKKTRKVLKFQNLILSEPNQSIPISRLETQAHRIGFTRHEAIAFILKFLHVFEIFEHPVQRILFCRLTRKAILQIEQERLALADQVERAVTRLRKMIMMSNGLRLRLEHVRIARSALGLPDDFEYSVVLRYPEFFRLVDAKETRNKYIELVEFDPKLAKCAIEDARERVYRERGSEAEDIRFSFLIDFPPGFKISKYFRIAMWKWQRLPYWSPYEDVLGYDLRSIEAQKRMEKRAVATIHELLSLTVEKKITLERIAHFRMAMNLPKKLKEFLLQHQGIFYVSTRGNHGKLHTVFLREAYSKGELVEPNDLYLARRKLVELVLLSPRKARVDRELIGYRRSKLDDEMGQVTRAYVEDACEDFKGGDRVEQGVDEEDGLSSDIGSDVDSANEDDDFDDCVSNEKEIS
ncbi:plant organelle RNA recognition domain protein [Medicago truncatula]|uniref:Plant organelle RNA recognition domain protein n=1 Tax=Medicago truncatula TaxID=3880 RepID=A0A072UIR4_MEDTR|nr:plant organelle RNA recognition domain protein [Medicago truncatula]